MTQVNTSMNFLPEDYVEKRQAARAAVLFIGLLLVVVGGIVGAYMYTQWQMKTIFDEHDRVNAQFDDASKKIAEAQELEKQKSRMIAKAEITTSLMERVRKSTLLAELSKLRPKGVNFVSMELKTKDLQPAQQAAKPNSDLEKARRLQEGLPPEQVKPLPSDVTLTLTGTAPTDAEVAAYMRALQNSSILTDVNLLFSEEYRKDKDDAAVRRFQVELRVNPDADLRGPESFATAAPKR